MEWVEITGRTVEEAKEAALDQLGVDTVDAEFEILEEPSRGLFGKMKGQARVRARIAPTRPRPKVERRDRRKKGNANGGGRKQSQRPTQTVAETPTVAEESTTPAAKGKRPDRKRSGQKATSTEKDTTPVTETVDVDLAEHTRIVTEFLDGLVDAFELEGRVEAIAIDDDTSEVRVEGRDLGILVGPKGNTLAAIQDLSRTVIHRKVSGTAAGRVRLDVGGYRQRRREALERFTQGVAEEVRTTGVQKALEPMGSADRKIVHDTVNELDGVSTISEGAEPRRRVVIVPA